MSTRTHPPRMHVHHPAALTPRQRLTTHDLEIIHWTAAGMKNAEIAYAVGSTEYVIKNQLRHIYDLLGLDNRVQLALWYAHETYVNGEQL